MPVGFSMFQSGHRRYDQDDTELAYGQDNWKYMRDDYELSPVKPTLDGGPSYEGIPQGLHNPSRIKTKTEQQNSYSIKLIAMKKISTIIALYFFSIVHSFAQPVSTPCDQILAKPLPSGKEISAEAYADIQKVLESLLNCGIDSVDLFILTKSPLLSTLIVDQIYNSTNNHVITYQHILNGLSKAKQSDEYQKTRTQVKIILQIINRPASINTWEEDKSVFENLGVPDSIISKIFLLVKDNKGPGLSYGEIFEKNYPKQQYRIKNLSLQEENIDNEQIDYYDIAQKLSYSEALSISKKLNTPVLLYFTGFSCVNALKMESKILKDGKIKSIIDNRYIFLPMYVDDRTNIPQDEWYKSEYFGLVNTIGKRNLDFQTQRFKNSAQPFFVIINSKEELIDSIGYTPDISKFEKFLIEGFNKIKN